MKVNVFLSLCILAITSAAANAADSCDCCKNSTTPSANVTMTTVTSKRPLKVCRDGLDGMIGMLQQIAYLIVNILMNIGDVLQACAASSNGAAIFASLRKLLDQLRALVVVLVRGASLSVAEITAQQDLCQSVLADTIDLLDSLLNGKGSIWACTKPLGTAINSLEGSIKTVVSILNGSLVHDLGVLAFLLNHIIWTINLLLACLVLA